MGARFTSLMRSQILGFPRMIWPADLLVVDLADETQDSAIVRVWRGWVAVYFR